MALPVRRSNGESTEEAQWSPFNALEGFNRQLAGYLDPWRRLPELLGAGFTPLADVEETDEAYVVEVELPGVNREDIDIEIAGRRVSVRGERKEKERVGILRRRERTVGSFAYEVTLPGDVVEDGVEAHLNDGVLHVRVPKPERERPRRIEIR